MRYNQYRQQEKQMQMQMQMNTKPAMKADNKIYRVQNPVRSEVSLSIFFFLKPLIKAGIKKTALAHPQAKIIYDRVGGSWWKPEIRIIVGGKTKKVVEEAAKALEQNLNGKKKKKE
ncbi:MAG: hypothetical protein E6713_08535 [Sporomusaceae bacterium]|nr:hypothetical protein [Sporomusaceae bacterium]